jgi:DNA-binding XRE family transcriptional regulator
MEKPLTPKKLKNAREKLDLTQHGMGEALGLSERFITYRESGVRPVEKWLKYAVSWLLHTHDKKGGNKRK